MAVNTTIHYNKHYLESEARQLANFQVTSREKRGTYTVSPLLEESRNILTEVYRQLAKAAKKKRELSTAGEWILDNFYIIQEQIVQIKEDLPPSYYKKLPIFLEGEFKGLTRAYALVEKIAFISDNIIDIDNATVTIQAYQEISTLKLSELWAIPIFIRLVLIERLKEKAEQLLEQRKVRDRADEIIEDISKEMEDSPGSLLRNLPEITADSDIYFHVVLAQRLQAFGLLTEMERNWFDYKFRHWNTTLEEQLHIDTQQTSRLHLSVQNAISTLRETTEINWTEFVENCSVVERILRLDPSGYYGEMDLRTRDNYRKTVEKVSEYSAYTESEVAQQVLIMAEKADQNDGSHHLKHSHVGYYLMDRGFQQLAQKLDFRGSFKDRIGKCIEKYPGFYFGIITLHILILLTLIAFIAGIFQAQLWLICITFFVSFLPALHLGVVSTNRILTLWLPTRILPKLKFENKVPDEYRTIVVVPTLFSSVNNVKEQFEFLEIRALANPNRRLQFVMLSDFHDADEEITPVDKDILKTALYEVDKLNQRYSSDYGDKFFLLHRKRLWNKYEEVWMGWERKRGKLEEFNRLLKKPSATNSFISIPDQFTESVLTPEIKYVITLDGDTELPPGSAIDMIRTAAHPLNRPELNHERSCVVHGYGIIQPRISILPAKANKSWFSNIYSGDVGLDPYTTSVSDIYQDLFGEGIYTGKGLYDLDVFEQVLGDRIPQNKILSHDLLESTYLRCGLATDIELFDDFPSNYLSYTKRIHRWIRGDWQILQWLFPRVPVKESEYGKNPINKVSRWKILDNLRRPITPLVLLVLLLSGWLFLPGSAIIWSLAVLGILAFPIYSSFSTEIFTRPRRVRWLLYLEKIRSNLKVNTIQAATTFMFLPHQAYISVDAIVRTVWRLYVSNKNLLEWTTSSKIEGGTRTRYIDYWTKMWINIAWVGFSVVTVWILNPKVMLLVIPFELAWLAGPFFAYLSGKDLSEKKTKALSATDVRKLRTYARRTWHYFEQYVNEDHFWLPPDNFQEEPYIGSVGRTSPTNIGLSLASTYVAYDLGYLTVDEFIDRIEKTLNAMGKLDRYSGHFYNWYSTQLGEVLNPRYISTVDSGNLAANLILIKQALIYVLRENWPGRSMFNGIRDTIWVLEELLREFEEVDQETRKSLLEIIGDLKSQLEKGLGMERLIPEECERILKTCKAESEKLRAIEFSSLKIHLSDVTYQELTDWFSRPDKMIDARLEEIRKYLNSQQGGNVQNTYRSKPLGDNEAFSFWRGRIQPLIDTCDTFVQEMDFSILYYPEKDLFSIGYNVGRASLDKGTYDLLASEARLASFIAVAKGDVPPKHWFRLSRRLTSIERNEILLSWGGTMFEYLMPLLYMEDFKGTLLSNTYKNAVRWQREYANLHHNPWGFSESGYAVLNIELHYQYRAFGAPGLGLRRGLAEDYVVSPYASMLALMVNTPEALNNMDRLRSEGAYGMNGFYEAVDYTPKRGMLETGKNIVKMYMAHHQGMSLLALSNVLNNNNIQKLFHSEPLVRSCELLLQERIPKGIPIKEPRPIDVEMEPGEEKKMSYTVDHVGKEALYDSPPRTHILSNGEYSMLITHAGTGFSTYKNLRLTRWRSERVKDAWGFFFYIRDLESNNFWSSGYRPVNKEADRYDTWFQPGKVQTARVDDWIETFTEYCVSPEDNIELRKITLTNYSDRIRHMEVTSYGEVVLNEHQADRAHPAFSNLFVQTDQIPEHHSLLAKRRPREKSEQSFWLVHTFAIDDLDSTSESLQYETDRQRFIGRGRSLDNPRAMDRGMKLSGTFGNVSDPIVSIRSVVELQPGEKKTMTFGMGIVRSREEAVAMADHYDNPYSTERVFELASIYGRVELEHLGISNERAHYFQKLAGALIYGNEQLRTDEATLLRNHKTQSDLWAFGISGDIPIVLYRIENTDNLRTVEELLKAHAFWRMNGLEIDLVILNDHPPSYIDELQEAIFQLIQTSLGHSLINMRGGVFVLRGEDVSKEDQILIETVSAACLKGVLPKLDFRTREPEGYESAEGKRPEKRYTLVDLKELRPEKSTENHDLLFYNGFGGFTPSGDEYVIHLPLNQKRDSLVYPPAPYANVIANENFGFIVSERGSDFTWSVNSRENRLTPWSNDVVIDPVGEAVYIRDEDHRLFWSPVPGPSPGSAKYEVRHGFGYTSYTSRTMNIDQKVTKWVPLNDPVKIIKVRLSNTDLWPRHLSIAHYLEWVLGVYREQASKYVVTEFDSEINSIFASNKYNNEFADRVAFTSVYTGKNSQTSSFTTDRTWFIGKNRGVTNPRALSEEEELSHRFGGGVDPCAASLVNLNLQSGEAVTVYFMLGEGDSHEHAVKVINKYQNISVIEASLKEVKGFWKQKLGKIQISTPEREIDLLFNGWLQYQNIACRLWGRSGFYQSGGAFGFRDQLQDACSAMYLDTAMTRKQILLHAENQFEEGDVLHWWHPPSGRGVRTRITDDLLWLPYATAFYIRMSGDTRLLDRQIPFIHDRALKEEEAEAYLSPEISDKEASLYEHCCRAIDRSLTSGKHGLPLIGTGDWNDGMNSVGEKGKGESVWLGFFLYAVLSDYIPICREKEDSYRVEKYVSYQNDLKQHLNREGWDGAWYRRAFFDDGSLLGSVENDECQIDAIAQAWAIISKVAPKDKALKALDAAGEYLISEEDEIIRLLTPPFDKTEKNPGYIKGYIPGVRENGGQYTHAALWMIKAFAEMGFGNVATYLMKMVSPINHSMTLNKALQYRVEPYVVAADIYGEEPLTGMGGWTWYTGSAGWMYRVIIESILGLKIEQGKRVLLKPTIPTHWERFSIRLSEDDGSTTYLIEVHNEEKLETGQLKGTFDGAPISSSGDTLSFQMKSDHKNHRIKVNLVSKKES